MVHLCAKYFLGKESRKQTDKTPWAVDIHFFSFIFSGKMGMSRLFQLIILSNGKKNSDFIKWQLYMLRFSPAVWWQNEKRKCSTKINWKVCGFQQISEETMQHWTNINANTRKYIPVFEYWWQIPGEIAPA